MLLIYMVDKLRKISINCALNLYKRQINKKLSIFKINRIKLETCIVRNKIKKEFIFFFYLKRIHTITRITTCKQKEKNDQMVLDPIPLEKNKIIAIIAKEKHKP